MELAYKKDCVIQTKKRGRRAIRTGGVGVIRAVKGITLVISNKDMDDVIRIIKSLENLGVFIDGVSETVKHEIK